MYVSIYLISIYLFIYFIYIYLSIYLLFIYFIYLSVSIYFIYLSIYLSIYIFIYMYVCMYVSIYFNIYIYAVTPFYFWAVLLDSLLLLSLGKHHFFSWVRAVFSSKMSHSWWSSALPHWGTSRVENGLTFLGSKWFYCFYRCFMVDKCCSYSKMTVCLKPLTFEHSWLK